MSPEQQARLESIADSILKGPTHPSSAVREKFSVFSAAELENAVLRIRKVVADGDGFLASHVIAEFYKPGSEANVVRYVNMTLPKPKK